MSEQIPSMGGLHQPPETIESLLSMVRENLEMDVAFVSEFAGDQLVFRALEGDVGSFGWQEGEGFPLDESYCKRVLAGGRPYGTLCCVSHRADPRLRDRDLGLMEGVARELSRRIKREGLR